MPQLKLFPAAEKLTVLQVADRYLAHLRARLTAGDYKQHTYDDIEREIRRFAQGYGDQVAKHCATHGLKDLSVLAIDRLTNGYGQQLMPECRQHDLTEWLDCNPQWKSNFTRRRVLSSIVRPFLWAEDEELIDNSPYRKPRKLKLRVRPRRPANHSEYVLLMRTGSRALRRALFFLRRSGARPHEMRDLLRTEVNLEGGYIWRTEQKNDNLTNDGVPRIIGLDPALIRFLRNLERQAKPGQTHVFLNTRGQPWKDRQVFARHLRRYADRLDLAKDLCAYSLRHLYGTDAIDAGVGDRQLADQMGHKGTRMIAWYAHTSRKVNHLKRVAVKALKRNRDEA